VIPYFELDTVHLGPLPIHTFGLCVAAGLVAGSSIAARVIQREHGAAAGRAVRDGAFWALLGGLVGGHLMHVLGYHPELLRGDPWVLLRFWDGLSSMGGLVGGTAALVAYLHHKGHAARPLLNALALGTAPGWAIARIGCFLVHDHPGVHTHFFLAVMYPDGPRHDLGLDDLLVLTALSALLFALARRPRPDGFLAGVLAVGYAVPRFLLDFLRATDVPLADGRIFGLTPAQYVCMALVPLGLVLIVRPSYARRRAAA